jgi:hypothetical protein
VIEGDRPAKADVHVGVVYDPFTHFALGQRDEYHEDFDPVLEPALAGTQVKSAVRRGGDYRAVPAIANLLDDGGFEDYTGSGESTDWTYWFEDRSEFTGGVLQANTTEQETGSACLQMGNDGTGTSAYERVSSAPVDLNHAKTYLMRLRGKCNRTPPPMVMNDLLVYAFFYDELYQLLEHAQVLYSTVGGLGTSYSSMDGYLFPENMPSQAAKCEIVIVVLLAASTTPVPYYYFFDSVVFGEATNTDVDIHRILNSHAGRAFVSFGASFGGSSAHDEITAQALLRAYPCLDFTAPLASQTVSLGNPNTRFKETFWTGSRVKLNLPSHGISRYADLSKLAQVVRLAADPQNAQDFWCDHVALLYYDRAFTEVSNWSGDDHLILDSRSGKQVMVSVDGTLNTAVSLDHSRWKSPPAFEADPDGMNMSVCSMADEGGDHQATPIFEMSLTYNPCYLLVKP